MTGTLAAEMGEVEAHFAIMRQRILGELCASIGCDMRHLGGRNAGCSRDCCCSVPVYVCSRCSDSDYGDNPEAQATRAKCAEHGPQGESMI